MCEEDIIRYCAPTLAGIKTGSLFACIFPSKSVLRDEVRCMNRRLLAKGLRVLPLSFKNNRALLYFFRPDMLKHSLSNSLACQLLAQRGYPCENPDRCIIRLMEQLRAAPEFPHEIGLFLGYPPEDVQGFLEEANQRMADDLQKKTGDVLSKVLYEASMQMKNGFARSDA